MSSSNGPPNPGTPRVTKSSARVSVLARHGSKMLAGGVLVAAVVGYYSLRPPAVVGTKAINPLRTTGVANIEGAYKAGGATSTHTLAYGGTKQGDDSDEQLREGGGTGNEKGFDHPDMGDRQRSNTKSLPTKKFKEMQYGSSESK